MAPGLRPLGQLVLGLPATAQRHSRSCGVRLVRHYPLRVLRSVTQRWKLLGLGLPAVHSDGRPVDISD